LYAIPDLITGRVHLLTAPVSSSVRSRNPTAAYQQQSFVTLQRVTDKFRPQHGRPQKSLQQTNTTMTESVKDVHMWGPK